MQKPSEAEVEAAAKFLVVILQLIIIACEVLEAAAAVREKEAGK